MNIEIKFRALKDDISNCRFYYGSLIYDKNGNPRIYDVDTDLFHTCIKGTESQLVGIKDINGVYIYDSDICKVESKHGFHSDLLTEFKELNNLDTINGISGHFIGIIRIDFFRGLMFENPLNKYREPIFNRKIDISINHSGIEIIGNIFENPELLIKQN